MDARFSLRVLGAAESFRASIERVELLSEINTVDVDVCNVA